MNQQSQAVLSEWDVQGTAYLPPNVFTRHKAPGRLFVYSAAITYASFVTFFPWYLITGQESFEDFDRYVSKFNTPASIQAAVHGWRAVSEFFTSEVLWSIIVRWLTSVVGDAAIALRLVSFFICLVWGVFLFRRIPFWWAFAFLINPRSIEVALSNVRNGFAWSLVIVGLSTARPLLRIVLFAVSPFIHSSSAALLTLMGFAEGLVPRVKSRVLVLMWAVLPAIAVALALTIFNEVVLGALGDRRIGEAYVRGGGSALQSSFWGIVLITQLTCSVAYLRSNALVISLLVWYLVMNPFIPWSHRLWGAFIPVVAYSIWQLPARKRAGILYLWLGYLAVSYLYWTQAIDYFFPLR